SRGGISAPAFRTISTGHRHGCGSVDKRHLRTRESGWAGTVELDQAMELGWLGRPAASRGVGGRGSIILQTRGKKPLASHSRGVGSLDTLGVLARLAVLRSGRLELSPARGSVSKLH